MISALILFVLVLLLEHSIKYQLYIFGVSLVVILFIITQKTGYKFTISIPNMIKIFDYFLIVCSLILFTFIVAFNPVNEESFYFSVIVSFFLPGWVLLRILGIVENRKTVPGILEVISLSFVCSVGLTALSFFILSALKIDNFLLQSGIFLLVSLVPVLKNRFRPSDKNQQSFSVHHSIEIRLFDILILGWIFLFFIFVISSLYPDLANNPYSDISRLFSLSEKLITNPTSFGTPYAWYNFNLATILGQTSPPAVTFLSGIAFLSIFVIISFYIMSRVYLSDIEKGAHRLATVFFFVFAGFGWVYFIQEKLTMFDSSKYINLLLDVSQTTYWDILYGQGPWLWLWFRPLTVGFTIFFVLLYLMKQDYLSRRNYIIIVSFLMLTFSQIHIPELVIFIFLIFFFALFRPKVKLRIKETSLSALIGLSISPLFMIAYQYFFSSSFYPSQIQFLVGLAVLSGLTFLLLHFPKRPKINLNLNSFALASIFLGIFFALFVYWFSITKEISLSDITKIYAIPWEFYPVLLGIIGVLSIPGSILVYKKYGSNPIVIFLILIIFVLVFGRLLTFINAELFSTGYWERRLIPFIFAGASIFASLFFMKIFRYRLEIKKFSSYKKILVLSIFASVVLAGTLSTFLTIEFFLYILPENVIRDNERKLQNIINEFDPKSMLLTLTDRSRSVSGFTPMGLMPNNYRNQLWPSSSPEMTLEALSFFGKPSIILLNDYDLRNLPKYENSHIASHIVKNYPAVYEGPEGKIIKLEINSHPSTHSELVLVNIGFQDNYYAYDILSLGNYNYTTVFLSDVNSLRNAKFVVVPNEDSAITLIEYKKIYNLPFEKLFVLNLDGYGSFVQLNLTSLESKKILDYNKLSEWKTFGMGSGKIDVPYIESNYVFEKSTIEEEDEDNNQFHSTSQNYLSINVGKGNNSRWEIKRNFNESLDVSEFDYVKFNWFGRGDGKRYVVQFTSNPGESFWHTFDDTWKGWKQIKIPLNKADGYEEIFEVMVDKGTTPGATWEKIDSVRFRTESSNENQGGEFFLNDFAFVKQFKSSKIMNNKNDNEIEFSSKIKFDNFISSANYDTIAYYEGGNPFILHKFYEDFEIFYLNVKPIIDKFNSADSKTENDFYQLGNLLDLTDTKLPKFHELKKSEHGLTAGNLAAFKNATIVGNTTIFSSSAIISLNNSSISVNFDGENLDFEGVHQIIPININELTINSQTGVIDGGSGYYTRVFFNSSTINLSGNPSEILIQYENNNESVISGKEIEINLPESTMLIRLPTVKVNGLINFEDFIGYRNLGSLRVLNEDIQFLGNVTWNTKFSDEFNVVLNPSFKGNIIRSEPIYPYEELINLRNIFN